MLILVLYRRLNEDPIRCKLIIEQGNNITNCTQFSGIDTMIGKSYSRENVCNKLELMYQNMDKKW